MTARTDAALTAHLLAPVYTRSIVWRLLLLGASGGVLLLVVSVTYSVLYGPGVWGNQIPVAWAFPIINFVFWIGIGHAGTFISAFLLVMAQEWRASINRLAEAMTLFALVNAGIFPLLHLGRPWFGYWLFPYPATMGVWPQFKSSLPWDMAAVSTYLTVSLLFWYLGLIPDLATARDAAGSLRRRRLYGLFALGWRGSCDQWRHYTILYGLLAALAIPLVISVHSVVSLDFAIAQLPGWHSTIFPPYFVVGAIYSGFAMVLCLLLPIRWYYGIADVITDAHLDKMAKTMLTMCWMMTFSYAIETFVGWYSADRYERYMYLWYRPFGTYALIYWLMLLCNVAVPQVLWAPSARRSPLVLFAVGLFVLLGMWVERFDIVVSSLARDFLPSSWDAYVPTLVDWGILFGSFGLFAFLFLLFLRFVPFVPIAEVKKLQYETQP
ncbi:MAG: NrfD/PsrC family molybdoenzyme membrane anchor subunit [Vicinamibacterales bacterium]